MPSTGKMNGTLIALYIDVSSTPTKITHLVSNTMDLSTNMIDTTTKDSGGDEEVLPGLRSSTFSAEGHFAEDATYSFEDLYDAWEARTALTARMTSNVTGDKVYTGTCYIESLSRSNPMEDVAGFSVTLRVSGGLTKSTQA